MEGRRGPGALRGLIVVLLGALLSAGAALAPLGASADPDPPEVHEPSEGADLWTSKVYVSVEVLEGEDFEVWLTEEGQAPEDLTSAFVFASPAPASHEIHHAHLEVPLGAHELLVVQHIAATSSTIESDVRSFARVAGPVRELGPIDGAGAALLGTTLQGALERSSGTAWLLFGETTLPGPVSEPSAQASSADPDASDGIALSYFDAPGPIEAVLPLAAAAPGENDEEEVWLTAPFERGSDVFAYYVRVDRDATPIQQGVGLAKATGAALPFARLSFPAAQPPGGGHFDDDYSLFQGGAFPRVRGVVVSGSYLLLFGQQEGVSGLPEDRQVVLARAPLSSAEDPATYEYWTELAGVRAWRTSATGIVPLFENASAPSVAWSAELGRWLAAATQEEGALPPYAVTGPGSAIQLRVADDPRGPWSPPVSVWDLPGLVAGALGTAAQAIHLSGFDAGSLAYLVATDAGNPAAPPIPRLYEVDLDEAGLPAGPIAPQITTASGSTSANPTLVKGYAAPGDTVRLVIGGGAQWLSTTAAADGAFQLEAALYDGANTVQAVASRNGLTSPLSSSITLTYTNAIDRNINTSGKLNITANTVWTPGTGSPYLVTGTLNIAPGVYLAIQPGASLRFQTSASALLVRGDLRILGTSASPVKLGPNGVAEPLTCATPGGWAGIDVNHTTGTGTATIEFAQIGCAKIGIEVHGDAATVRDTSVYNSQNNGIYVGSGGTATLERVTIDRATNGGFSGIDLNAAGAVLVDECTVRRSQDGLRAFQTSPVIVDSLFELNSNGLRFQRQSNPEVSGSTIRSNTTRGVWVEGNGSAALDPLPTVEGNDIHGNTIANLTVEKFGDPLRLVAVSGNWWGSSDPATIASKIQDATDSGVNSPPFAAFTPFLGASITAGGQPVPGNYLNGPSTGALVPGQPYEVVGKVLVPAGPLSTLTIQAGSELRFHAGTFVEAKGLLHVAGTAIAPVQLHSAKAVPAVGDWEGVKIIGAGAAASLIEHAIVDHAFIGVRIESTFATVRDSTIREFGRAGSQVGAGVWVEGEGGATDPKALIRGTRFSKSLGGTETEYGIYVSMASPSLEENEIRDCSTALHLRGSAQVGSTPIVPLVTGNEIEGNATGVRIERHADPVLTGNRIQGNSQYGILVMGQSNAALDPRPVVNGNEIHGNGNVAYPDVAVASFGDAASTVLDFERNWWGTSDLFAIAARINDQSETSTAPIVDFAPPLDGPGGAPIAGQFLAGPTAPGATLAAGVYVVVGGLTVPPGETLVVQGGARLEFLAGAGMKVKGSLDVQGGPGNLATFTAAGALPTAGSWDGILVESTATATSFDYARIEYATRGIDIRASGVSVTNSEFGDVPSAGYAIYGNGVPSGTITGNLFDNSLSGLGTAIELYNATFAIDDNHFTGFYRGIGLTQSAALITANWIEHQGEGIRIGSGSSPSVTNGNLITENGVGIQIQGNGSAAQNPSPTIQGNQIRGNTTYNLFASTFGNASTATVAATLNYWGSEDPGVIGAGIGDRTDPGNTSAPTVLFTPYLDDDLQPISGSYLNGTLTADLSLAASTTWDVVGDLVVPAGRTLTIAEGVTLRFASSTALRVQGTLDVNGTAALPAIFTSAQPSPAQAAWDGIVITAGSSTIDYARVEFADRGIDVRNAAADVRHCEVYDFGRPLVQGIGIYFASATGTIEDNWVERRWTNTTWGATAIHLYGASPAVTQNTVTKVDVGIHVEGAGGSAITPSITGNLVQNNYTGISVRDNANPTITAANIVTGNTQGISVTGDLNASRDPAPIVNGNDLAGNTLFDFAAGGFGNSKGPAINAEGNWWGLTSVQAIADRISDEGEYSRPVDFAPFLDGSVLSGGTPVAGSYLVGPLAGGTSLAAGTYEVTGPLRVAAGQTVTFQAGAVLEFADEAVFEIDGTLLIQGTAVAPVVLTSLAGAGPGDWKGVVVRPPSAGSSFTHARIEHARTGIDVRGATSVSVSESEIESFLENGILFMDGAGGTVHGSLIRNGLDSGTGIYMQTSSPTITSNEIRDNGVGVEIQWGSNPTLEDNEITSNGYGLRIKGGFTPNEAARVNPVPVIRGNSIYANRPMPGAPADVNLRVLDFWYAGTTDRIDVSENWWGTSVPADIRASFQLDDPVPAVIDYTGRLDGAGGNPISGNLFTNILSNVRHSGTTIEPAFGGALRVDFDLLAPGTVDFVMYHEDDWSLSTPLYMGSQTFDAGPQSFNWDGRDNAGSFQDDGAYRYVLKADGGFSGSYSPQIGEVPQKGFIQVGDQTPTFNAFKGEPWKRPMTVTDASRRVALHIQPDGKPPFLAFDRVCYAPSPTPYDVTWDGIDPTGQPVVGHVFISVLDLTRNVTPNHIVLRAVAPGVTGPTSVPSPTVHVKSDPSLVYHSYDQFTRITYELDREATVGVKLLPPGIVDPNDPSAIVLQAPVLQATGEHTVTWLGHDGVDTNAILAATEGLYTFVIQATGTSTGKTSTTRGALNLRK